MLTADHISFSLFRTFFVVFAIFHFFCRTEQKPKKEAQTGGVSYILPDSGQASPPPPILRMPIAKKKELNSFFDDIVVDSHIFRVFNFFQKKFFSGVNEILGEDFCVGLGVSLPWSPVPFGATKTS